MSIVFVHAREFVSLLASISFPYRLSCSRLPAALSPSSKLESIYVSTSSFVWGGSYLLERVPVILSLHCHLYMFLHHLVFCLGGGFIPTGKSASNSFTSLSSVSVSKSSCFVWGGSYLLERVPVILSLHCHHVSFFPASFVIRICAETYFL